MSGHRLGGGVPHWGLAAKRPALGAPCCAAPYGAHLGAGCMPRAGGRHCAASWRPAVFEGCPAHRRPAAESSAIQRSLLGHRRPKGKYCPAMQSSGRRRTAAAFLRPAGRAASVAAAWQSSKGIVPPCQVAGLCEPGQGMAGRCTRPWVCALIPACRPARRLECGLSRRGVVLRLADEGSPAEDVFSSLGRRGPLDCHGGLGRHCLTRPAEIIM